MAQTRANSRQRSSPKPKAPAAEQPESELNPQAIPQNGAEGEDEPDELPDFDELTSGDAPADQAPADQARPRARRGQAKAENISIWEFMEGITEAEFAKVYRLYVYRMEPFTAANQQEHKYVLRYDQRVDIETMKADLGSGKYFLRLNRRTSMGTGGSMPVMAEAVPIEDPRFPPRIPPGPWMEDPRNRKWRDWFTKKEEPVQNPAMNPQSMVAALKDMVQIMRPNEPAGRQENIVGAVIEAMKTSHNEAFQMFQKQSQANDPTQMITLVMTILDKVAPKPTGADPMLAFVLEELKESRRQNSQLMEKFMARDKADNPLNSIQETLGTISAINEVIGTKGGTDWKQIAADAGVRIMEKIAPVLPAIMAAQAGPKPQPPPGYQPQMQYAPQAPAQPTTQAPAQAPAQADDQAHAHEENPEMMKAMYRHMLSQVTPALLNHINTGASGIEFADWFIAGYGAIAFEQVRSAGKEAVFGLMKEIPELWQQLAPMERTVDTFLSEFFEWEPAEPEDADEPPQPLSTVTAEFPTDKGRQNS